MHYSMYACFFKKSQLEGKSCIVLFSSVFLAFHFSSSCPPRTTTSTADFEKGSLIIDQPGAYKLCEDIIFHPNPPAEDNVNGNGKNNGKNAGQEDPEPPRTAYLEVPQDYYYPPYMNMPMPHSGYPHHQPFYYPSNWYNSHYNYYNPYYNYGAMYYGGGGYDHCWVEATTITTTFGRLLQEETMTAAISMTIMGQTTIPTIATDPKHIFPITLRRIKGRPPSHLILTLKIQTTFTTNTHLVWDSSRPLSLPPMTWKRSSENP